MRAVLSLDAPELIQPILVTSFMALNDGGCILRI